VLCVLLQMSNQLIRRLWLKHLQGPRRVRNYIAVCVFFLTLNRFLFMLMSFTAEPPSSSVSEDTSHERSLKVARMTEIEDLQAPRSLPYAPLCIKVKMVHMS
jgi:hypothetical protein